MRRSALWSAVALTLLLPGCVETADDEATGFETLDTMAWKERLDATPGAFLLDVRTPDEYQAGHIPGSTLIPHTQVRAEADSLPEDKDTPIFVYCRSGNRSTQASHVLVDLGYTDIVNMRGGYPDWAAAGYPTETGV